MVIACSRASAPDSGVTVAVPRQSWQQQITISRFGRKGRKSPARPARLRSGAAIAASCQPAQRIWGHELACRTEDSPLELALMSGKFPQIGGRRVDSAFQVPMNRNHADDRPRTNASDSLSLRDM